jgi:hypothetical protein
MRSQDLHCKRLLEPVLGNTMLKINFNETLTEQRWILHGRLIAPWVRELRTSWKKNHRRNGHRACIVDLNEITFIDKSGERLLRLLVSEGAQCIASGAYIKLVLDRLAASGKGRLLNRLAVFLFAVLLAVLVCGIPAEAHQPAQMLHSPELETGKIIGTVTDENGDTIPDATVVLSGADANDRRTLVTPENGFFELDDIKPGIPYQVSVSANGFANWTSPEITLDPGQFKILTDIALRLAAERTTVQVTYNPVEVATEQMKLEEQQRVFGIIPNFYVSYDPNAAPLTPKLKFQLALKVAIDPLTIAGVTVVAGAKQAGNTPNYGQGMSGFSKRFGAVAGDGFTDIIIGGALLPSVLHQDPRYFYQGTGTARSRIRHALLSPFICKGDNGTSQPSYSTIGGVLASSAIANLYYPQSNRGAGLVFSSFAIGMGERIAASLAQEFVLGRFTHRGGHVK